MERIKRTLSVDPTEKKGRYTTYVLTDESGWSEVVLSVNFHKVKQVGRMIVRLADKLDVDRVLVRGYGIGVAVAEWVAAERPEEDRSWEVWTSYRGPRKELKE